MKIHTLTTAILIGLLASIAFIIIQPYFGMLTLTSRHASAYINLGGYNETVGLVLSWLVHVGVSIFYTLIASLIYNFNHSFLVSFGQVIFLGWLTTLIATPANEWVVKLITTGQFIAISIRRQLTCPVGVN